MVMTVVTPNSEKHLQNKCVNVGKRVRIASELRIIPTNVSLWILHFQCQQIIFVEEENNGDALKRCVIDYRVKNIFRLFKSICSPENEKKNVF